MMIDHAADLAVVTLDVGDASQAQAADAFVDRRIDNVMTFEKWKAGKDFEAPLRRMTDALSRLRYR